MSPKDGLDDLEKGKNRSPTGIRTPDNPARRAVAIPTALVTFIVTQSSKAFRLTFVKVRPPLWSSGHNFWLQIQRSRVRFPALLDFLSSSGSGTGSTQPREELLE